MNMCSLPLSVQLEVNRWMPVLQGVLHSPKRMRAVEIAAQSLGVGRSTVRMKLSIYQQHGWRALVDNRKLSKAQSIDFLKSQQKKTMRRSPYYQADRAALLHKLCNSIVRARSRGVPRLKSIRRACTEFRRSLLARSRGVGMSLSSMRSHFSRWQKQPDIIVFKRKDRDYSDLRSLQPEEAASWETFAINKGLSVAELHRHILRTSRKAKPLSYSTLCRALRKNMPVIQYARRRARRERAVQKALSEIAADLTPFINGGLYA